MKALFRAKRERAIVIGGSVAGLLAARALADRFHDVVLIERDALDEDGAQRRGIPQGRHTHVLLASGCRALESFFPGITRELVAAGAPSGDVAERVRWFVEGARLYCFTSGLDGLGMSRGLLERVVRGRIRNIPNIRVHDNAAVDGLAVSRDNRRIVGVTVGDDILSADLVIDATGRGSRSPLRLKDIGYEAPHTETIGIELRYTTRLFRSRPNDLPGCDAVVVTPTPTSKRGGVIVRQENARWSVTLMTHFGDFPPQDLDGFIAFARALPASDIYDVIHDAEPIGDAQTIRVPASVRRRYERLKRFPAGYLVIGDALSSFNPIYGQGMAVAALEAAALGAVLRRGQRRLAPRFFGRTAKIIDAAWSISANNDLRMPEAGGRRTRAITFVNWYVANVLRAGHHDAIPAAAFLKVSNLLAPPRSLMHPLVAWRVMLASLSRPADGRHLKRSAPSNARG